MLIDKVHIFLECHKVLRNLHLTFVSVCTVDKSKAEISQNFVAFSEYTNFKNVMVEKVHQSVPGVLPK